MIMINKMVGLRRCFLSYGFSKAKKSHTLKLKIKQMEVSEAVKSQQRKKSLKEVMISDNSIAGRFNVTYVPQLLSFLLCMGLCVANVSYPFAVGYRLSVTAAQGFATLFLLLNLDSTINTKKKTYFVGGWSILANCIPFYSLVGILAPLSLAACHYTVGNNFITEHVQLTKEEEQMVKDKLRNRMIVYFSLLTVFILKVWVHLSTFEMESKLSKYDLENKKDN